MEYRESQRIPVASISMVLITSRTFLGERYLCDLVVNDLLVCHIALVAYEKLVDTLCGVPVNLLKPLLNVVERVHIGNIVDDTDAMGTTVV